MRLRLLPRARAPESPPFVPENGWEHELVDASRDADAAAAMLCEALYRRRRAASGMFSETRGSKAALSILMARYSTGRGLWWHGFETKTLGEMVGAPHVTAGARSSFEHMAKAAIEITRSGRPPLQPAPADTGIVEPVG